jgi:hypothetical protein
MARTVRSIIKAAQRKLGAVASGDDPQADELTDALEAYNNLVRAMLGTVIGSRLSAQANLAGTTGQAEVGGLYYIPAGVFTITAPLNPRGGARFGVVDANLNFGTNNCTVSRNGKLLEGAAANLTLNTNGGGRQWFFESDSGNWVREADQLVDDNCLFPDRFSGGLGDMLAVYIAQEFGGELRGDTIAKALEGQAAFMRQYGRRGRNTMDAPIRTPVPNAQPAAS